MYAPHTPPPFHPHLIYLSISCLSAPTSPSSTLYLKMQHEWCHWRCDLWLQLPTTSDCHNSSFYPILSCSIHLSRSLICLFTKRKLWYEDEMELMLVWCRLQHPTIPVTHNLSCHTFHPLGLSLVLIYGQEDVIWELAFADVIVWCWLQHPATSVQQNLLRVDDVTHHSPLTPCLLPSLSLSLSSRCFVI